MTILARILVELVRFVVGLTAAIIADKFLLKLWNARPIRFAR